MAKGPTRIAAAVSSIRVLSRHSPVESWQMAVVSTKLCGSRATLSRLYSHRFQPL